MDVNVTEVLPEDMLADVLRRLAPRWLAASRCVCRCWRATVDSHGLLRAILPLLPRSVAGIFMENRVSWMSLFLCRPSTGPAFTADLRYTFVPGEGRNMREAFEVRSHCNGLVLLGCVEKDLCVVNPATRQWTRLPPRPRSHRWWCTGPGPGLDLDDDMYDYHIFYHDVYLVFDPTITPHFEVYSVPRVEWQIPNTELEWPPAVEELEWPPSPCILQVYSSETGRWEERSFVREGSAAGITVAEMRKKDIFTGHRYAVYWRGTLYVQCQTDFIMRLTLSSRKYKLIQPPEAFEPSKREYDDIYGRKLMSIGKSEKGVYSVVIDERFQMKVWILDDSNDGKKIEWVPKQLDRQLIKLKGRKVYQHLSRGRWRLQPITSYRDPESVDMEQERFEWDSDNDDDVLPDGGSRTGYQYHIGFLGFHPYKEVIFLNDSFERVLAYHLNSSKIQDLGYVYPEDEANDYFDKEPFVHASFPYTPCWMGHDGRWKN